MQIIFIIIITLLLAGCQNDEIKFEGEAAFEWLEQQCDFGPRNPGSNGYFQCREFLINNLHASIISCLPLYFIHKLRLN